MENIINEKNFGSMRTYGNCNDKKRSVFSLIKEKMITKPAILMAAMGMAILPVSSHAQNVRSSFYSQESNLSQAREANNSVLIVLTSEDKDTALVGTGTVIKDSNNLDGHNRILTALHVVSVKGMSDLTGRQKSDLVEAVKNKKYGMKIYDSKGEFLGYGKNETYDRAEHLKSQDDRVSRDMAVVSIKPVSNEYDKIPGATIAKELPKKTFFVQSGDIGFTHGASGSGLYHNEEIVGVFNNYVHYEDDYETMSNLVLKHSKNNEIQPTFFEDKNEIPKKMEAMLEDGVFKKNYGEFAPLGSNPIILKALGNAGKGHVLKNQIEEDKVVMFGYPDGVPIKYEGKMIFQTPVREKLNSWFNSEVKEKNNSFFSNFL